MSITNVVFAQTPSLLARDKVNLIIYTEHWPPYQFIDEQGALKGSSVEKVKTLLNNANWPYEIIVLPWARALYQAKKEPNSLIFSIAKSAERESQFHWLALLGRIKSKIITFDNQKDIHIDNLSDIKKYTIILKRAEVSSEYFIKNNLVASEDVIWVNNSIQAFDLLKRGRGDLYAVNESSFIYSVKDSPYSASQFKTLYDFKELNIDIYIATSTETSPELVNELKKVLNPQ